MNLLNFQKSIHHLVARIALGLFVFGGMVIGFTPSAAADYIPPAPSKVTVNFACTDKSTSATRNKDKNNQVIVQCANSGVKIDYVNYANYPKYISMTESCSHGYSAIWTPNSKHTSLVLACKSVTKHDSNGTPIYSAKSLATPSVSSPQVKKGDGAGSLGPTATQSGIDASSLPQVQADQSTVDNILSIFFGILGGIAVLVVAIGGLRYILANGDPSALAQAKNTILYAIIGLLVAVSGYAIVTFVLRGL